nr:MAG TPA: hypothetical protein [Caudoviricetes sp.]
MAWYLRTAPAYLARASGYSKEDEVTREKNRSYIETPPFERTTHDPHHRFCHQERCFHPRNCSRILLYWQGCELPDEARCWCSAAFHRAP